MSSMKSVMNAAAVVFALGPAVQPTQAVAQPVQNPQVEIAYGQPTTAALQPIAERVKKLQVLEQLKIFMAPLKLPRKLTVRIDQCGAPARLYRPGGPVTICYELIDQIEKIAAKADQNSQNNIIVGAFVQALFHEVAKAVFDQLQVPIWGRSEDAADRLAGLIMVYFGDDVARGTIVGTAQFFAFSGGTWTGSAFATTGSPEAQRYFNYLCMAYGSDPKTFEFLVKFDKDKGEKPVIPEGRFPRCAGEFAKARTAFNLRIMPYVDPDLLVKVRSIPWLR